MTSLCDPQWNDIAETCDCLLSLSSTRSTSYAERNVMSLTVWFHTTTVLHVFLDTYHVIQPVSHNKQALQCRFWRLRSCPSRKDLNRACKLVYNCISIQLPAPERSNTQRYVPNHPILFGDANGRSHGSWKRQSP
jgi:hypothetical protein